jgi:hypothetical protein
VCVCPTRFFFTITYIKTTRMCAARPIGPAARRLGGRVSNWPYIAASFLVLIKASVAGGIYQLR